MFKSLEESNGNSSKKKKKSNGKSKYVTYFPMTSFKESFSKPLCGNLKDDSCELLVT